MAWLSLVLYPVGRVVTYLSMGMLKLLGLKGKRYALLINHILISLQLPVILYFCLLLLFQMFIRFSICSDALYIKVYLFYVSFNEVNHKK